MCLQIASFGEEAGELNRHLRANLETTRADSGSDRDGQVFGARPKAISHGFDRPGYDLLHDAAPARVNSRHSTVLGVGHQDGQAVSRSDRQCEAGPVRDQTVGFPDYARVVRHQNFGGVDLAERG